MDFTFTEEQQAAREIARTVFSDVAPDSVPSPQHPPVPGGPVAEDFDRPLWQRLATTGVLGLPVPESYGGAGLDALTLCLALREAGGGPARVPLLETGAAALTLATYADERLGAALLPRIADGTLAVTAAAHGSTGHEAPERAVEARRSGDSWVLDGIQTAVPWAPVCDLVAVPAHTPGDGPVLAFVAPSGPGVTLAEQVSTNGERYAALRLGSAAVPAGDVLDHPEAAGLLQRLLATGTCALALGLGTRVLEMTSRYVSEREQFGHPLATFQAVAVQAADRYVDLRAMEATLWQAAWRLAPADIAVAKIWASEGVRRVAQTAQHLHGGAGADTDYALHRYHAWAKQLELAVGPPSAYEEALGDLLAAQLG
ncbi:acyl-CoA dehydrogenase family protein [Streptomyces boncukensis]|uniref:Acyl-CoA/acyl-ACP dehydrogenase n=1 Tax=Streptomyces boncukensis TaxID=2711219 RepID=A0A6G4X7I7_9ACTN|nr:acyl-CoA/acyl-ACP dehydrogenase [Streptomyces boncukensis]